MVGFRPTDRVPAPSRARAIAHRAGHSRARRRFCARTFVFFSATMAPITLDMLRRRAEHNEGLVSTLEEISLHQQEIERIENLGQLCRHLKILYMQNNLVSKLQNLHRLKELEYANFAVNNIRKIENLQRCESLAKLDLTVNFIDKSSLLTVHTLEANYKLEDLYLMGNPCADFSGYRVFVVGTLPQLRRLDGKEVTPSERILATQQLPEVTTRLLRELRAEGVDVEEASRVSDARDLAPDEDDVAEMAALPEDERPWCPATRVAEQRETARQREENDAKRREHHDRFFDVDGSRRARRREGFPDLPEDHERVRQCNEPGVDFRLEDSEDGAAVVLELAVGKYLDTSLVDVDVQPRVARVLVKGKLVCLALAEEVRPDASVAQRSKLTGALVLTMPKVHPRASVAPRASQGGDAYVVARQPAPGWAASGTGSDAGGVARTRAPGRKANGSSLVSEMGGVRLRGIVDAPGAGGGLDMTERVADPAPAVAAKQHAVYGDDDDDEPPPL